LVQVAPLAVTRDSDRDFGREHDPAEEGLFLMTSMVGWTPRRIAWAVLVQGVWLEGCRQGTVTSWPCCVVIHAGA
jgi:hypothetical protein